MVTCYNITFFIHTQTAISISVIGKAHIQSIFHYKLLQTFNMGRTCIVVDICTIWFIVNNIGVCAKGIKYALRNVPAWTISTIQSYLNSPERIDAQGNQIAHITVTSGYIVYRTADSFSAGKGKFCPVPVKYMKLTVNIVLNQQQGILRHFFTIAVD